MPITNAGEDPPVGETGNLDVRISFHPGQFCVLASDKPDVVERSIDEFEYHVNMARWMGYGKEFQDMKINIHISWQTWCRRSPTNITRL